MDFTSSSKVRIMSEAFKPVAYEKLRQDAIDFPMMIVISTVYPCNFGCPNCPYSEGNSNLRDVYRKDGGDYLPEPLWNKIALEAGNYGAWLRCTGGGEPIMHPRMTEMIEFAKKAGCRVWLNTNGSLFGPGKLRREKLERIIQAKADLIEFSMDAADARTYDLVRPPIGGSSKNPESRWEKQVSNVVDAIRIRNSSKSPTRIVVSVIRQKIIEGKIDDVVKFWIDLGVDEVITRKFLSWDDNTSINLENSADVGLYQISGKENKVEPCVWPFERLNIDTLGRVALCGQDISFRTAKLFPNANDVSIKEIWQGETFTKYRKHHLNGVGGNLSPCNNCSAWKAGVRDWQHGWIKVLQKSEQSVRKALSEDLGTEVEIFTPHE